MQSIFKTDFNSNLHLEQKNTLKCLMCQPWPGMNVKLCIINNLQIIAGFAQSQDTS